MHEIIRHALALAIGVVILSIPIHAVSVLVWFLVNNAIPDVLVCKADAGHVGWRVERAKRCTFTPWDLLPWRFYGPLMRDLYIAYYFTVGYSEDLPCFPGTSRIYIHSAPFPTYAFSGVHNIKRVTVRVPGMGGPVRPFHYTVFTDRQASQDGFQEPDDILRNHNFGNVYERLYGNVVAVKNECLSLSDGILRPYEEAVRVINATMEDTGIINDVLEVLIEDHTIGLLAIPADAIWVEVNPVRSTQTCRMGVKMISKLRGDSGGPLIQGIFVIDPVPGRVAHLPLAYLNNYPIRASVSEAFTIRLPGRASERPRLEQLKNHLVQDCAPAASPIASPIRVESLKNLLVEGGGGDDSFGAQGRHLREEDLHLRANPEDGEPLGIRLTALGGELYGSRPQSI
ncbi:hypothetical protein EYR36_002367 [Pleurotus pulmonarius]|nr:hypothetical protein EYR36_003574 [Pleurotus pulmonarius]KAF4563777.1 hypothetical protein EYR36_003019 [Pleurotus pulmonarius]KAF4564433.1 hypothetical protein EYR36_002367 [Pleurotus pulmonarius]